MLLIKESISMRKRIEGKTFSGETVLQDLASVSIYDCVFAGGEYALKGSRDIILDNCDLYAKYPLWDVADFKINDSRMFAQAEGPICSANGGKIIDSDIRGIQALRDCQNIFLHDCTITSPEFGWKSSDITIEDSNIHAAYLLHKSNNIRLNNVEVRGDFSFQYVDTLHVGNCYIHSNEAFRYSKNVTVADSVIQGTCIGWYSENLTLIGCKIIGKHPLCHCKNLKLIDCVMEDAIHAFEGSDVKASISGHVASVKNPLSGRIVADAIGEVLMDEDKESACKIQIRG